MCLLDRGARFCLRRRTPAETTAGRGGGALPLKEDPERHDNDSTYEDHLERSQAQYLAEFDSFWGRLTPKQRKQAKAMGIEGALLDYSSVANMDHDAADTPAASYREDVAGKLDHFGDRLREMFGLSAAVAMPLSLFIVRSIEAAALTHKSELLGKVCGVLLNAKNVKLAAAGLAFASNLAALNGLHSMREYSRKIHVSVAAISKTKKKWQEELDLQDSPHSKDPAACAKYAAAQSGIKHWRKRKFSAAKMAQHRSDEAIGLLQ